MGWKNFIMAIFIAILIAAGAQTFDALAAFTRRQVACVRSALDPADTTHGGCFYMPSPLKSTNFSEW